MNPDQRDQVRSNALYLRNVRPIDPDEIFEYVEGRPHPAAVRQALREQAPALGLVERADGTFVPVDPDPVAGPVGEVTAFPDSYGRVLEDRLVERYGPEWYRGESGDALRERIRAVKEAYLRGEPVEYDTETALAYALYHLPGYYAAVQYVLAELVTDGLLPRHLRVVDVGAGVGGPALGLADLLPDDALVEYHAVEPGAGADVLEAMLAETGRNFHATVHRTTAEEFDLGCLDGGRAPEPDDAANSSAGEDGGLDLVLFANVWSELDDPAAVTERYAEALAPDGTVVGMAPADRNTAVGLREVERAVADRGPLDVYAPTARLWPGESPGDDCWSFDVGPDLEVPAFQRRLDEHAAAAAGGDEDGHGDGGGGARTDAGGNRGPSVRSGDAGGAGEFVNVDVQFAYTLLRRDGRRRYDVALDASRVAKLGDADRHVTSRVDCYAAKLSHDLSSDGNPLFRVGDGSQREGVFAVLANDSALNRDLLTAGYGDLLAFQGVLVLRNEDEGAYNLVVDEETVVDRVPD
ncbi:MAG: SAM-dependent methyltransferase [Haloarculaceae archaeon]